YDESCEIRTFPQLADNEKKHIWVTHNETTFHTYNGQHAVWGPEGEHPLRKKGLGPGVHVSDFLTKTIGRLKDDLEEVREMIVIGARYDGFWDIPKLLQQVKRAVNIFKRTHSGCI
ncbi:23316_t:CDS:1, partial [Gigaspora margarita]